MVKIVQKLSDNLNSLPLLPVVVVTMMVLSRGDENYFEKIQLLAHQDPSFALRIIKLANSAAYSSHVTVSGLKVAVARNDVYQVASLVTAMTVMQIFIPSEKDVRSL